MTPVQRLQRVQESALAESGGAGEPIHVAWRRFLRGRGPSTLVIDATGFDPRARGTTAVLDGAPWLLAEGVLIAAGLRDSLGVELRLPRELTGHEAALLNAVDAMRSLAEVAIPRRRVEIQRDCPASPWGEGHATDGSRLVHTPETWCRLALLFAGESAQDASLLTLRRGMRQRGLVELAHSGQLRRQIEGWGGAVEVEGHDAVLVFDDGLGGFLPVSEAGLSCEPQSLSAAGVIPAPSTLMVMARGACESTCVTGGSNGAVFIRTLKAKAAEHCLADGGYPMPELAADTGQRVGIIGSGPSGLTAAYYLRTYGHQVEVLESQEKAGGMLRYGIPAYRLPPDLLEQELDQIRVLGVPIHTGTEVGSIETFRRDYDAVFLGLGTQRSRLIPIDGIHQPFVRGGIDFLRAVRSGDRVHVGPRVVVVGGGNVAIDVALTALRKGATHVDLVSLEKRRELPASPHEIEIAVAEGVQLHPGWGPVRIDEDGEVTFQLCERVHDEAARFDPTFDTARLLALDADHVILATGQGTDLAILDGSGVATTHGYIVADSKTLMTDVPGVFAGGDAEHGPRTAVEAIRSGKIAAAAIDAWLRGAPLDSATGRAVRRAEVVPLQVDADERTHLPRAEMPERSIEEVLGEGNYVRIELGLTDVMAHDEARRCLRCDVCIGCGLCMAACSEMGIDALRMADTPAGRLAYFDFTRPADLCIGCGACMQVCPTGAIHLEDGDGIRRTIITGTVVREQPLLVCSDCGAPTQTPAHRDFVRGRLPDHLAAHLDRELCPACARRRADRPAVTAPGRLR